MEAISGKKPMVNYWLHTGFLTVKGKKMAKSLGNFITIKDFLKDCSPRTLRLFVLKSHYRSPIDYNEKLIFQTKKELERIDEFISKLKVPGCPQANSPKGCNSKRKTTTRNSQLIKKIKESFEKAMDDDFNTPKAVAVIFELINKGNSLMDKNLLSRTDARDILKFLQEADKVFGFISWSKKKEKIPKEILKLANKREKYRQQKKWGKADEVRKDIEKLGYKIKDTAKGPKIKNCKL